MNIFLFSYLIQWGQVRKSALHNALWEGDSLQPLLQRAPASAWLAQHTRPITLFYPPATGWPKRVIFPMSYFSGKFSKKKFITSLHASLSKNLHDWPTQHIPLLSWSIFKQPNFCSLVVQNCKVPRVLSSVKSQPVICWNKDSVWSTEPIFIRPPVAQLTACAQEPFHTSSISQEDCLAVAGPSWDVGHW